MLSDNRKIIYYKNFFDMMALRIQVSKTYTYIQLLRKGVVIYEIPRSYIIKLIYDTKYPIYFIKDNNMFKILIKTQDGCSRILKIKIVRDNSLEVRESIVKNFYTAMEEVMNERKGS
jgi:hypothetical protein